MTITVDHYGLHWIEGDIALLVQRNKVEHVLGVPVKFDVTVKLPRQGALCPHNIDLSSAQDIPLPDDPLVNAMLPLPKEEGEKALFIDDTADNKLLIQKLMRLSSSNEMRPMWTIKEEQLAGQLRVTNIAPLVLFGYDNNSSRMMRKMIEASYYGPRRLIIIGPKYAVLREEIERIKVNITSEDIGDIELERAGAYQLKKRMENR